MFFVNSFGSWIVGITVYDARKELNVSKLVLHYIRGGSQLYLQRYLAYHTKSNLRIISAEADSLIASSASVRTLFLARRAWSSSLFDERPGEWGGDTVTLTSLPTLLAGTLAICRIRKEHLFSQIIGIKICPRLALTIVLLGFSLSGNHFSNLLGLLCCVDLCQRGGNDVRQWSYYKIVGMPFDDWHRVDVFTGRSPTWRYVNTVPQVQKGQT